MRDGKEDYGHCGEEEVVEHHLLRAVDVACGVGMGEDLDGVSSNAGDDFGGVVGLALYGNS